VLPSEGKGQKFESSRARHDFNDLAGLAKSRSSPRKHHGSTRREVIGQFVALLSATNSRRIDCAQGACSAERWASTIVRRTHGGLHTRRS
jgi:hypothetical protein